MGVWDGLEKVIIVVGVKGIKKGIVGGKNGYGVGYV